MMTTPVEEPKQDVEDVITELRRVISARYQGRDRENHLNHAKRFALSLDWIPNTDGRLIELGSEAGIFTDLLKKHRRFQLETTNFDFNLEKDPAPYPTASYDGALLMEVMEHFAVDPMFALAQINRILKLGGFLFLSTPNIACWRAIQSLIHYRSPYLFGIYTRTGSTDRHNREYTVEEIRQMVTAAGFKVERIEGINVYEASESVEPVGGIPSQNRGDTTFCLCRKDGPVRDRYPSWLYW